MSKNSSAKYHQKKNMGKFQKETRERYEDLSEEEKYIKDNTVANGINICQKTKKC